MKYIIVAYDRNRAIGAGNQLPWAGRMRTDMQRLRQITSGNALIMGRNTYDSIGRPLPNRQNIVVTHRPFEQEGVTCVDTLEKAYAAVEAGKDTFIFGGGQIYTQSLDTVDRIYATEIDVRVADTDAYFPNIDMTQWREISREHHEADSENAFAFDFVVFDRVPS